MTRRGVVDRLRSAAWPMPSPSLRARVLAAATSRAAVAIDVRPADWAPPPEPNPRPRLVWRLVPVLGVTVALVVIGSCTGLDLWAWRELDVEIARLEAKYGSLDDATVQAPPVPDADNRATVIRAAAALAVPMPGKDYHHIPRPVPFPLSAELRAFADANRDAIRSISDLRTRRQVDWGINHRDWRDVLRFDFIRILSDALYITALMDLEAGRADDAAQAIASDLGILASVREEPGLFWLTVGFSWPLPALRELVSGGAPSAAALEDLAVSLAENRTPDSTRRYLLAQMRMRNAVLARLERGEIDPISAEIIYPMSWPDWPKVFMGPAAQIGRPFVRTARLRYLRYMDRVLDVQGGARPRPVLPEPEPPKPWALVDRLVGRVTGDEWDHIDHGDDRASELAVAELGVALRRYKLDRGAYPESLSALTPAYLDRLPIDPYTGELPAYARLGEGFTLRGRSSDPYFVRWLALEWTVLK